MIKQISQDGHEGYRASLHYVDPFGMHTAIPLRGLAEASLSAVLTASHTVDTPGESDTRILAWVDFPLTYRGGKREFVDELANTHLPIRADAKHIWEFVSAGQLISGMIREADIDSRLLPHAYQKTTENFTPVPDYPRMVDFVRTWLLPLCEADRPHPPMPTARTDSLRMLASLINLTKDKSIGSDRTV